MASRTYTLLVTIHDDELPDPKSLGERIQRALEEGLVEHSCATPAPHTWPKVPGVMCASVDALVGDQLMLTPAGDRVSRLHRTLRD